MSDRRSFLGTVSGAAAGLLAARSDARPLPGAATAPPAPPAAPLPSPTGSPKPPSAEAVALARGMRRFDPALSEKDVEHIAASIDAYRGAGARLNPNKATTLKNGDEPVTRFSPTAAR